MTVGRRYPFYPAWAMLLIILLSISSRGDDRSGDDPPIQCMQSFDEFAYGGPELWSNRLPFDLYGWQRDSMVPNPSSVLDGYPLFQVSVARRNPSTGEQEIWISGWDPAGSVWLIYSPESKRWEVVRQRLMGSRASATDLLVSSDGTLWAATQWDDEYDPGIASASAPVLARFDETSRRFTAVDVALEVAHTYESFDTDSSDKRHPIVLLGADDVFRIIMDKDGVYSFDPNTGVTRLVQHLDIAITDATIAADGTLYLSGPVRVASTSGDKSETVMTSLLSIEPETGRLITLGFVPSEWPEWYGMFITASEQLWMGSIGYRDGDGNWSLAHANIERYSENSGDFRWGTPRILTQTSDGKLWFTRYMDGSGEGTAWYDPMSTVGCLIYGGATTVVEDGDKTLWLVAYDGYLYQSQLP